MTLFNVLTPVVALIDADSEADALRQHADQLRATGHEVYDGGDVQANAFESEPVD